MRLPGSAYRCSVFWIAAVSMAANFIRFNGEHTEWISLALMRPASCTGSFINHTQMRVNLYQPSAN